MPTPPLSDDLAREALEAVRTFGSKGAAARALGIPVNTFRKRVQRAIERGFAKHQDEAIEQAMDAVGTRMVPGLVWAKTKEENGTSYSVLLKPSKDDGPSYEEIADRVAERISRIPAAPAVARPKAPSSDLRNFVPWFDVHLAGKIGSYGTAEAVKRLIDGTMDVLSRAPAAECTIILNGGDFTEQNDPSNQTPSSKHPLSVDGEYDDTTDIATEVTVAAIDFALTRSTHVIYKAIRGNHDPNTARILRAALRQRYRNCKRVSIDDEGIDFFAHEFGANLICAHHGDIKGKQPKDYVMAMAAKYPEAWGRTRFRELWTGHKHHLLTQEFPGMTTYQVRAITPANRYAQENLFLSESEIQCATYRKAGGRMGYTVHQF